MTLYLKYRPQNISELDLQSAREMLGKILQAKQLPHALLFSGPRGTGKTSAARILAKAVNCPNFAQATKGKAAGEPCNDCEMCREITAGSAADVIEIDAASNRGIDEIRDLREKVRLAPMQAKYKVYIIDEVHMLTNEAANALLKTLEEPPEKVIFVLCTTEPEKLPETVISRCTMVKFTKPSLEEIAKKLEVVARGESTKIDAADLKMVAKAAKGSFRDAIKILEQVLNTGMKASEVLGMIESADPAAFIGLVRENKTAEALEMINTLVNQGVNIRGFIERCVEELREEMLIKVQENTKVQEILEMVEGLNKAYEQTKTAAVTQLPLEIFVIQGSGEKPHLSIPSSPSSSQPHPTLSSIEERESKGEVVKEKSEVKTEEKIVPKKIAEPAVQIAKDGKYTLADVEKRWGDILMAVRPRNHSVEALLRSTKPVEFDGEKLRLEVFYQFHKDKLETEKCKQIVEAAVAEVFGVAGVKLYLRLGSKKMSKDDNLEGKVDEDIVKAATEIFKVEAI